MKFSEAVVENAALNWLSGLGYQVLYGPDIAPEEPKAERTDYAQVILEGRLRDAIARINRNEFPAEVYEDALRKILRTESPSLVENNRRFHKMFTDGVEVEYRDQSGAVRGGLVRVVDFENPENNDWLAVNQFTVIENKHHRRFDVVLFINGIPLVVMELKDPTDPTASIKSAFNQIQTYKYEIPSLFAYNEIIVVSDGCGAWAGTLTGNREWFLPWRTIDGEDVAPRGAAELQVMIRGVFEKGRMLDLMRYFITFETDGANVSKIVAAYHQYHAVNKAVTCTLKAAAPKGDKRIGVVWHTQGSGKSLSMAFYAGKIIAQREMENPTIVMLTDRNDLDDQLFRKFSQSEMLLRQKPLAAENRQELRELLQRSSGGVIFTTIQKFLSDIKGDAYPMLSERRNIVVIADEAHRSQYDFIDGFARNIRDALPNASFIGFTGTPIEFVDKNTPAVFGNYIDIYDIQRSIEDGATKPIYYESRLAKIRLQQEILPEVDADFEEVTEEEEVRQKEKLKRKWARVEAMVGDGKRLAEVAQDIVSHFEDRTAVLEGKGMIVCMSRRICVELYNEIVKLKAQWHNNDDDKGFIKVVMTGSASDKVEWQQHIRNRERRGQLATQFKDPANTFRLVIVRDMWLTGFDVPCLHTMYIDKPMRGHGLMQAIARVNRVYKDKPGGLIVDYLGIADDLKKAMAEYTESGGKGETVIDQELAAAVMQEKYEVISAMFHGFDYSRYFMGKPEERLSVLSAAVEHVLTREKNPEEAKRRYMDVVAALSKAFALATPHEKALAVRDDVGFFQSVKSVIIKNIQVAEKDRDDLDVAIKQIVSKAIMPDGVIDIFKVAGIDRPEISILSDLFLDGIRQMEHKNLALEVLRKLLNDEIKSLTRSNVVKGRSFSEMLEDAVLKYQNRAIDAAQVIEELIALAKEMREASRRGDELGLAEEELAFYDALGANDSAVQVLGDETLKGIARELVATVKKNATIDWSVRENARAKMRVMVKRILRTHGYPPDMEERAVETVIEQAELFGEMLAA